MNKAKAGIEDKQRVDFLSQLRNARAQVLRDAESFHEASTVLEYIGQVMAGEIRIGLGKYQDEILALAGEVECDREKVKRLFNVVRDARNMAVHDGAWARHLNSRLVDLFLILEEAIMSSMQLVEDLMARTPVTAEPWHLVAHVRKAMLSNSFSNIPVCVELSGSGKWKILTDTSIVKWVRGAPGKAEAKRRLSLPISAALAEGALVAEDAICCRPNTPIAELIQRMNHLPILVTEEISGREQLLGIIMPFDVL